MSARDPLNLERELRRGLVRCLACGRSGGHLVEGETVCSLCNPTPLRHWMSAVGFSAVEVAEAAHLSRDTVQVALRGERIGEEATGALAAITGLTIDQLRDPRATEDS